MVEKTIQKKPTISYDLNIIPDGISLYDLLDIVEKTGYVFYDSFNGVKNGCPKPYPYMINPKDNPPHIFLDISDKKNIEIYNKILKEIEN